jgi:hypothetical protein
MPESNRTPSHPPTPSVVFADIYPRRPWRDVIPKHPLGTS